MKIAVVMALYNGEKFIHKQLDSLRNQTQAPEQVIMCDDGSNDRTVEIVSNYIKKYGLEKTWKLSKNKNNLGYIKNFYHAISLCDADLIFFSDQDDLWNEDKIFNMTNVMKEKKEVKLLSCKYGIVDAEDNLITSIMEKRVNEDYAIRTVTIKDIMQAYRWPGMAMCVRKEFFDELSGNIIEQSIPHDLALAILAADKHSFYEYNYVGVYHRRHNNNLAREEHRIFKLLNLQRKLKDIDEMCLTLNNMLHAEWPITEDTFRIIDNKFQLLKKREAALKNRNLRELIALYKQDSNFILRKSSFICDLWLLFFGKYR